MKTQINNPISHNQFLTDLQAGMYKTGPYHYDVDQISSKPDLFSLSILEKGTGKVVHSYRYNDGYLAHNDVLKAARVFEISFTLKIAGESIPAEVKTTVKPNSNTLF